MNNFANSKTGHTKRRDRIVVVLIIITVLVINIALVVYLLSIYSKVGEIK